jgi:type I restriction enzyme S subunit
MGLELDVQKVNIDLIANWMMSRNLITIADISTIPQINNKHIYPLEIALPKLQEQIEIFQSIKKSSQKINSAISLKEREIERLKEYKATLINSAVTGKIKVNNDAK